jgi:hypothetical protein
LALRWLGKELPPWPEPCPVRVKITAGGCGGATTFSFDGGKVQSQAMTLEGSLDQVLANVLPHEVTHTVLAHHFRSPVPRWADEGAAVLSEDAEEQRRYERLARQCLDTGRCHPLSRLLSMKDYPQDVLALFAQSYSLTHFLVAQRDRPTFLAFVRAGMAEGWDEAVRLHYRQDGVKELEKAWTAYLREQVAPPVPPPVASGTWPERPPPQVAVAGVDDRGGFIVAVPAYYYEPRTRRVRNADGEEQNVTRYELVVEAQERRYPAADVEVYDTEGRRLTRKDAAGRLSKRKAVLVSADGREVDPFYLQVAREGTLVLVVKADRPPAKAAPAPRQPAD